MIFKYRALSGNKMLQGKIDTNNKQDVVDYLRNNGYFPVNITAAQESSSFTTLNSFFDKVNFNDIVNLTRQLAIMLNAGLTLIDCFEILKKQLTKVSLIKIIESIDKDVKGGSSFSSALLKYPKLFSKVYVSLVKSGEASGKLGDILLKLSDNLEKNREFRSKIKGAMIYPVIVIIGMVSVIFIMITFVLPSLLGLYKDFNIDLPVTTKILIAVSSFSANFWPIIVLCAFGLSSLFTYSLKTKRGKLLFDKTVLKIPVINNVIRISTLVDSTRTLSILVGSGVSILEALNIIVEATDNVVYQQAFSSIYKQVEKGTSLGSAMTREGVFPPILVQMTIVSKYFEMESEMAVKAMTTLIEPTILVILGVGVGFLVMSVISPIYNLTSSF
jgi:type IV pilus assembly protein PilC